MTRKKPHSLESLSDRGRRLLNDSHDPTGTHSEFESWDHDVAKWLDTEFLTEGTPLNGHPSPLRRSFWAVATTMTQGHGLPFELLCNAA